MTLQALSGQPVRQSLFDPAHEAAMGHIELARWADLILVAPASADYMARMAAGMADDLLATICLATEVLIALAPAMNQGMWRNSATCQNARTLLARGALRLGDRPKETRRVVNPAPDVCWNRSSCCIGPAGFLPGLQVG